MRLSVHVIINSYQRKDDSMKYAIFVYAGEWIEVEANSEPEAQEKAHKEYLKKFNRLIIGSENIVELDNDE
ncbi:hypothetical protein LJB88_04490 [Erysipelotrichaceae bacterium OttesenSCG-928-M19]|nr:hypothetical protein [Erysipelotrichaceae bacterium OttesenSCG-928-M19]